jgi:hypothetical protein
MKKFLAVCVVLALVAPAMAAVDFEVVDNGDGTATIQMNTGGDVVRGIALKVVCTGGAKLVDKSFTANAEFNTFIDYFAEVGVGGVSGTPNQQGDPFSLTGATAGRASVDDPTFGISMGVLDENGAQAGYSSTTLENLITINVGAGNICVDLEADYRGGIVGDVALTTDLPICKDITDECITSGHTDYTDWVAVGKPDSWCWTRQCHGDGNNDQEIFGRGTLVWVGYDDLAILIGGFRKLDTEPEYDLRADFNRRSEVFGRGTLVRVGYDDLSVLLYHFRDNHGVPPADCLDNAHTTP